MGLDGYLLRENIAFRVDRERWRRVNIAGDLGLVSGSSECDFQVRACTHVVRGSPCQSNLHPCLLVVWVEVCSWLSGFIQCMGGL